MKAHFELLTRESLTQERSYFFEFLARSCKTSNFTSSYSFEVKKQNIWVRTSNSKPKIDKIQFEFLTQSCKISRKFEKN